MNNLSRGYSLVELIVSIGVFTIIAMIASGAYLIMINANREAQAITTGINNLAYALESMTHNIRTGTNYDCTGTVFTFTDSSNVDTRYSRSAVGGSIMLEQKVSGVWQPAIRLTDPLIRIDRLDFLCNGSEDPYSAVGGNIIQANVTIVVRGIVSAGPGASKDRDFYVETMATMRSPDL